MAVGEAFDGFPGGATPDLHEGCFSNPRSDAEDLRRREIHLPLS
ncbi:MAG: hypothetical protein ACT4QC_02960 [Planctomycetaceae bacterium]